MGIDTLRQIDTGLDPVTAEREQWDDGNNTLAIAPRVAVAYERNVETNTPARGGRHRGRRDRRLGARLGSRRAALHVLPDRPRRDLSRAARRIPDSMRSGNARCPTGADGGYNIDRAIRMYGMVTYRPARTWPGWVYQRVRNRGHLHGGELTARQTGARRPLVGGQRRRRGHRLAQSGRAPARPAPRAPRRRCPSGRSQTGDEQAVRPEHPDQPVVPRPGARRPAACSRAQRVEHAGPRRAAAPSAGARGCRRAVQYAASTEVSRSVGVDRLVGLLQERRHRAVGVLDVGDPEVEAVVHGDLERLVRDQVLEPRARRPGPSVRPTMLPGSASQGLVQHGGQVAARVAVRVLHLQPEPDRRRPRGPAPARPSAAA